MNILTKEHLYKAAPSISTQAAAEHSRKRYQPIDTSNIINVLPERLLSNQRNKSASRHKERKAFVIT